MGGGRGGLGTETLRVDLDLYGRHVICSEPTGATLFFEPDPRLFTVLDVTDGRASVLRLFQASLGRLPLEAHPRLSWTDVLPAQLFRHPLSAAWTDFFEPFLRRPGVAMRYELSEDGEDFVVVGRGETRRGALRTQARLSPAWGIHRVDLQLGGLAIRAERDDLCDAPSPEAP